jgi:hypothetical protein
MNNYSEIEPSDDLKANFRSWEIDMNETPEELENKANELLGILRGRHPDKEENGLKELAYDWVGYEELLEDL